MKNYFKFIVLLTIMVSSSSADAQWLKKLGDRLLKKAEKKTEQRVEDKLDKTTDKALDSIFEGKRRDKKYNNKSKKNEKENGEDNDTFGLGSIEGLGGMMENMLKAVEIADQYNFHTTIEMERFGAGVDVRNSSMTQRLGDSSSLVEIPQTKLIIDTERNAMITLMEERKEAQVINMDAMDGFFNIGDQDEEQDYEEPVISSMGSTIVIAGYTCKHMSITTSEQQIDLWITDEVTVDMSAYMNMFKSFPGAVRSAQGEITNRVNGFVMQMDVVDKKTDTFFGTKVKDIIFENTTVNMSDYTILKF